MFLLLENLEAISVVSGPGSNIVWLDPNYICPEIFPTDNLESIIRTTTIENGEVVTITGLIFTQEQVDYLNNRYNEILLRKQRAISEVQPLIGRGILSLTEAERWKLIAAVFYKFGVINSNGVVNQYSDWGEI